MIKHIYVTGDSFSFGQELGGSDVPMKDWFVMTDYMRDNSYTGIIRNQWGVPGYTNTSKPGGSNDFIHRKIIFDIPELLTSISPQEIFVFISITHPSRREFYSRKFHDYTTYINNQPPPKTFIPEFIFWQCYTSHFDDPYEACNRYITQICSMQSFLKSIGVSYLMTDSMGNSADHVKQFAALPDYIKSKIDRLHYPELIPFNRYASEHGAPQGKYNHPLEDGHRVWASYLMEYMKRNNLGKI